jgi:response regulator RpfG family c-di-GMP phosphodiesterase
MLREESQQVMTDRGTNLAVVELTRFSPPEPSAALLRELLSTSIVMVEDWELLAPHLRQSIEESPDTRKLLAGLVQQGLLTQYQADRIEAHKSHSLVLNNYRILERLGAGRMGVVFKAEHIHLRRPVAIKILAESYERDSEFPLRLFAGVRMVAQLQHPNIVAAIDAGETAQSGLDGPPLHYFVMDFIPGQDLDEYIAQSGRLSVPKACDLAYQVASALAEAHRHRLVHRDIKPSNIRVTPEGQAKLLDFGLARHVRSRITQQGTLLGTTDYLAPEQARDASAVDIRADIYGLGGTLFYCLTGRMPFFSQGQLAEQLTGRFVEPPPSLRALGPDVPAELDSVITRMLAVDQSLRYREPREVMEALLPFVKPLLHDRYDPPEQPIPEPPRSLDSQTIAPLRQRRVLIVDDDPAIRKFCTLTLRREDLSCEEAANGALALEAIRVGGCDLILMDVDMPVLGGSAVLRQLRQSPPGPNLKIIMISGRSSPDEMAELLMAGADDYMTKPFSAVQLRARINAALNLKEAQERSDLLNRNLLAVNAELERNLNNREGDLIQARNALVLALAKLVEHRDTETGGHLMRLQRYSRCLAEEAARLPTFAGQVTPEFIDMLECCAPLHDIGKVGLPDHVLLKPGKLTADERVLMQTHTTIGADTLQEVAKQHGFALAFLQMAADIARHHHERFDGTGYPHGLAGNAIPLAARLVALADVYDALRSRRVYKPALSHSATVHLMKQGSPGQFDPALLAVFERCAGRFEQIFQSLTL